MTKKPEPYIGAAYDSLTVIVDRVGSDRQAFLGDDILQDATLMRILEAGEYLARVRDGYADYYENHHSVAWNNLIGLRNIIAHGYAQVDQDKIWNIIQNELPKLISELKQLV